MRFDKLPFELLRRVLKEIVSPKDLAQCRRVCKGWNGIAEKLMFGSEIYIYQESRAMQFHQHLVKDPSNGMLVRHLTIGGAFNTVSKEFIYAVLPLVFTPNLQVLDAEIPEVEDQAFYNIILNMAQLCPSKFEKLRVIPRPCQPYSVGYKMAASYFKDSLQEISLLHSLDWDFISHFAGSTNLTTLKIEMVTMDLADLKKLLDIFQYVETLDINSIDEHTNDLTRGDVHKWFKDNDMKRQTTLKELVLGGIFTPIMLEFLVLRYAKIETADVDMTVYGEYDEDEIDRYLQRNKGSMHMRAIEALKNIPIFGFHFCIRKTIRLEKIIFAAQNDNNEITIKISEHSDGNALIRVKQIKN